MPMIPNDNIRTREREAVKNATVSQAKSSDSAGEGQCPHCGAIVSADYEICPKCGWKVVNYCTFCGAPMSPEDLDCPECGMPADGVVCPTCNVRNFRSFCKQCGQPLSRAARMAVEKAKKDPKVQEAARLLKQIAKLQAELDAASSETEEKESAGPTEGELRLQALMAKVGFTAAEKPKVVTKSKNSRSREEILAEYQKAVDDANRVMEEMLPPAGSTPQEQRNYYTARKVAMMELIEETFYGINPRDTMGWKCYHCQILHDNPSQCEFKEFGGEWVKCEDWKMWDVVDADTPGAVLVSRYSEKKVYK